MPIIFEDWQQGFKWQLAPNGLPLGWVQRIGEGKWLQCPLCGCVHSVSATAVKTITPICREMAEDYEISRRQWLKRYPRAAGYREITLLEEASE